uniref:Uncharacterized protein n=1 Tax=Hucho hucho TaxID=62062 RepID=A0A4W5KZ00_9TELE
VSADSGQAVSFRLEQITKLLYSIEEKAKAALFESVGYDGGHRRSLIPPITFEVSQLMRYCSQKATIIVFHDINVTTYSIQ